MNNIQNFFTVDWAKWFIAFFLLLFVIRESVELLSYFKAKLGLHTSTEDEKEEIKERLKRLEENSVEKDEKIDRISTTLEKIDNRLLNIEISGMRKEILDMASTLHSRDYKKEHYTRTFRLYTDYERILEENNMENGQVEDSMQVIRDSWKEKLSNGEFTE